MQQLRKTDWMGQKKRPVHLGPYEVIDSAGQVSLVEFGESGWARDEASFKKWRGVDLRLSRKKQKACRTASVKSTDSAADRAEAARAALRLARDRVSRSESSVKIAKWYLIADWLGAGLDANDQRQWGFATERLTSKQKEKIAGQIPSR